MTPFLSTRTSPPKRFIWSSPALTTASMAVVRKRGSGGITEGSGRAPASGAGGAVRVAGGVGRVHALHHPDFHAALGRPLQLDIVHEAANEKDAASARFQQVFRRERIGDFLGIEPGALVPDADAQRGLGAAGRLEFDE